MSQSHHHLIHAAVFPDRWNKPILQLRKGFSGGTSGKEPACLVQET